MASRLIVESGYLKDGDERGCWMVTHNGSWIVVRRKSSLGAGDPRPYRYEASYVPVTFVVSLPVERVLKVYGGFEAVNENDPELAVAEYTRFPEPDRTLNPTASPLAVAHFPETLLPLGKP
jgi:hypothetical protein